MRTKIFLCLLLVIPLMAQDQGGLKIVVLEGEGALNSIKAKSATQPVVEVRDVSDNPVEGAEVTFRLPSSGAGAFFSGYLNYQVARTDNRGRAMASGMTPNDQEGRFNIKVTATQGGKSGSVVIAQTNTANGISSGKRDHGHRTLYIVLGVVAAAAVGIGVAASHSGSGTPAVVTVPVTIAPGPISVGGPH